MASRSKSATRITTPAKKKKRAKKVPSRRARVPKKTEATKVTPSGSATRRKMPAEWKPLLEVAVAIEAVCDEVQWAYAKWSRKPLGSASARMECRERMLMLAQITADTGSSYQALRTFWSSGSGATPKAGIAKTAFDTCESFGVGLLLSELQAKLEKVARLLADPYSRAVQDKLDLQFIEIDLIRVGLSKIAKGVLRTTTDAASERNLPIKVKEGLQSVCKRVRNLILDTAEGERDDKESAGNFEERLSSYLTIIESLVDDYVMINVALREVFETDFGHAVGENVRRAHDNLAFLLEKVDDARLVANTIRTWTHRARNRAVSIDTRLDTKAAQLRDALKKAEAKEELLRNELDHWRSLLARAPFRHRLRRRALPKWEELTAKEQQVVAALVRLRAGNPDGPHFVTTRLMVDTAIGGTAGSKTSTTTWRILGSLDKDYEIVGSHQQGGSRGLEQATNFYWIEEDAFRAYQPHVPSAARPAAAGAV